MPQIPFNVSARAAMLIGRENIANSKGAIIELVKNCYDADSQFCIIYIDNELSVVHKNVFSAQKQRMVDSGINPLYFKKIYIHSGDRYLLKSNPSKRYLNAFEKRLKKLTILYIIDVGDGMSQKTILDHWMTIGTDNKLIDYRTSSKRIKSGAKGIGRFALDKLGAECTMTTIPKLANNSIVGSDLSIGSIWKVNWSDFEGASKTINQVTANLEDLHNSNLVTSTLDLNSNFNLSGIWEKLENLEYHLKKPLPEKVIFDDFKHGTVLKISKPNDDWNAELVKQVYEDLEILVPPKGIKDFRIFLLSSLKKSGYGEVLGPDCEDFDYKVEAKATNEKVVEITIYREEFEVEKIPKEFFDRENVKNNKFKFPDRKWSINYKFSELLEGYVDVDNTLDSIGSFDFTFYVLKRSTNSKDSQRFFYKNFSDSKRKEWLNQFAGIKIYRDNFRVRPYGEIREASFDWLGLGPRQSSSPAGVAKDSNGYKVRPENIAGAINISRLKNLEFADKSSREGLQETKAFKVFKNLIISIIDKFERDRSFIAKELSLYDKDRSRKTGFFDEDTERTAKEILEREKQNRKTQKSAPLNTPQNEISILARFVEEKIEENERLMEEQKLLRGMASSGIVAASFGHDLSKTKDNLDTRFDELTKLFSSKINPSDFMDVDEFDNPYEFIKEMRKDDRNIAMWLGFSLGFTRKDKRKRKQLFIDQFFKNIKSGWNETLSDRGVVLRINCPEDLKMRVFEIDFDSIFLNLLVNSIDAFKSSRPRAQTQREIHINCASDETHIKIEYKDTGPGLPSHLANPEIIFEPMYTTRRDSDGEEIGTGLGMWIVKTISDEYQANARLLVDPAQTGFAISFTFPIKYKSKA